MKNRAWIDRLPVAALLGAGYLTGQGAAFVSQIAIRHVAGGEVLGIAVLLLSFFSFAFQFSEYGNTTLLIRIADTQLRARTGQMVIFRAAIGGVVTLGLAGFSVHLSEGSLSPLLLITMPVAAILAGLLPFASIELHGNYRFIVVTQVAVWMGVAVSLQFLQYADRNFGQIAAQCLWLVVLSCCLIAARSYNSAIQIAPEAPSTMTKPLDQPSASFILMLSHVLPPLGGQLFGRVVLLTAQSNYGLAFLGTFGLAKYLQVAATLTLSFMLRPKNRSLIIALNRQSLRNYKLSATLLHFKRELQISTIVSSAAILGYIVLRESTDHAVWLLLLCHIPLWVVGNVSSQFNARQIRGTHFLLSEYSGLAANAAVFFSVVQSDLIASIVLGECSQAIVVTAIAQILSQNGRHHEV